MTHWCNSEDNKNSIMNNHVPCPVDWTLTQSLLSQQVTEISWPKKSKLSQNVALHYILGLFMKLTILSHNTQKVYYSGCRYVFVEFLDKTETPSLPFT